MARRWSVIFSVIALVLLAGVVDAGIIGSEDWPSDGQWIPGLDQYWNPIQDPDDQSQPFRDLVTDPVGGAAYYWYFDGQNLFFRFVLAGDPLAANQLRLRAEGWGVFIDSTGDTQANYSIAIFGTGTGNTIATRYFDGSGFTSTGYEFNTSANAFVVGDYTYVVGGYGRRKHIIRPEREVYYLDFYIPLEWLSRQDGGMTPLPVTPETVLRFAAGSGTTGNSFNADLAGQTGTVDIGGAFTAMPGVSLGGGAGGYGTLLDLRHDPLVPNSGVWQVLETVFVYGAGWPAEPSPDFEGINYFNDGQLNVQITQQGGPVVWEGLVETDSNGNIAIASPAAVWSVPMTADGIYSIFVEDPRHPGQFNLKDTFTVQGLPFGQSSKTVDLTEALRGQVVTYTIELVNSGSAPLSLTVTDVLSPLVQYVAGSTTVAGTPVDDASGFPLQGFEIELDGETEALLVFQGVIGADAINGDQIVNTVEISDGEYTLELTAETVVLAPSLEIEKATSAPEVIPGTEVVFTTTITNSGQAAALNITIVDVVPEWTQYISADGPMDATVEFRDGAGLWHGEASSIDVTAVRWSGLHLDAHLSDEKPSLDLILVVKVE